jgi:glycerol uptake facilitator-like aquaporin
MFSKRKVATLAAEFLGTGVLAFVVLTVSRSQIGIPYFVAFAAGLAVMVFAISTQRDVHLNPALTIGLWTARRTSTVKMIAFVAMQLLGGLAAYSLYKYFSHGTVQALPTAYDGRILVAEAVGAFVFTFAAVSGGYQQLNWVIRTVIAGAGLAIGIMVASAASAGFINPAVALASNSWGWGTYVLGPVLGGIIGVNLYGLVFAPAGRGVGFSSIKLATVKKAPVVVDDEDDEDDDDEDDDDEEVVVEKPAQKSSSSKKNAKKKSRK